MHRLQQGIGLALIGLLLLLCVPVLVAWQSLAVLSRNYDRASIAHEVLDAHLMLGIEGDILKRLIEAGARPGDEAVRLRWTAISKQASHIRSHVAEEIGIVGEGGALEEEDEFIRLDRIMDQIGRMARGDLAAASWASDIDAAVAHEHAEIEALEKENSATLVQIKALLLSAMVIVGLVFVAGAAWLRYSIVRPTIGLLQGMQQIMAGQRSFRIAPSGHAAMQGLQRVFNKLADQLSAAAEAETVNLKELEAAVANRSVELKKANAQLVQSSERRTQFLADISHELRTPLAIISGETDVALRNPDAPAAEHRNSLGRVRDQARAMTRLVDDLLYMARNEAGPAVARLKPLNLHRLIQTSTEALQPLLAADGGKLEFHAAVPSARVLGDEGRLRQLLNILLNNAMHYSEQAPEIVVSLDQTEGGHVISVQDKGVGIDPAELPHLFERFRRGTRGIEQRGEGSGLGLPLAKAIAESHGGSITIESATGTGTGTKVVVLLPEAAGGRGGG